MPTTRVTIAALLLATSVGLSAPSGAAGPDEILKCATIGDNAARLACYDRTVAALRGPAPSATTAITPATPPAPPATREQAFGAERIERQDNSAAAEAESMTATLVAINQQSVDRLSFTLDNGQVWVQVATRTVANIKPGKKVTIEKAMLGSFTMTVEGVTGIIKVRRVK